MDDIIYIGMKGSVLAIEKMTGMELWRTHLKSSHFVVVVLDGELIIAHTKGELFGIDARSGKVIWQNSLEGMGYGYATVASRNISEQQTVAAIQQIIAQQRAAQGAAANG